jgi:acetylornithine deacetylase
MVRINSINAALPGSDGGEAKLVDEMERWARDADFSARRLAVDGQSDQLLICHELASERPWVLFDSHLDTVAVEGMTIDPFGGELRDGKVWGRGSADTKGTGAAMLTALREYAAAEEPPNNVAVLLSVDEEVSMAGARSFVERDLSGLSWRPAAVVVGEPTELRPVIAHNGCLRWTITTHGRACHSSVPHEGRSAISDMVRVIDRIERAYFPTLTAEHPLTGRAVGSINLIRGGSAPNIVPDRCTFEIDRRTVPGEDGGAVLHTIARLLEPLAAGDDAIRFTQEVNVAQPPLGTSHNGPWSELIQEVLEQCGLPTLTLGAPFATNAAHYAAAGLPTVVLGPGSPHTAHTKDEWVAVEQIERGVELYRHLMASPLPTSP